jgi:hypothetical protein
MPTPDGCGMMHFDTPLGAHNVGVHRCCIGHSPGLSPALEDWQKGDKMLASSMTDRVVADPQLG